MKAELAKLVAVTVFSLSLAGCVTTPAVISDLEEDKVFVQTGMGTTMDDLNNKARQGCALHGRKPKEISYVCLDDYCIRKKYLFACIAYD